jgi:uncharacterized membrane protein YfcA
MTPLSLGLLAIVVLGTSFLSGVFGMAGGLILLGVLLAMLDVAPAMVLFGTIQLSANGWRAVLWRRNVLWPIVWRYILGSLAAFIVMRLIAFVPNKAVIYVGLGLMPFAVDFLPKSLNPDITRPGAPYLCGAIIMVLQLLAGAAGNVLDVFFQRSMLDPKTIVATKAATQVVSHMLRIAFFGTFLTSFDAHISLWTYGALILLALTGTSLAASVLKRMSNEGFRLWSRRLIQTVSLTYLARGLWLLLA